MTKPKAQANKKVPPPEKAGVAAPKAAIGKAEQADIQALLNSVAILKAAPQDKREAQKVHFQRTLDAARETGLLLIKLKVQQGGKRRHSNSPNVSLTEDRVPTLRELELTDRESIFCKEVAGLTPARLAEIKADEKVTTKIAFQRVAYPEKYAAKVGDASAVGAAEAPDPFADIVEGYELVRRGFRELGIPAAAERTVTTLSSKKQKLIDRVVEETHTFEDALVTARSALEEASAAKNESKVAEIGTQAVA